MNSNLNSSITESVRREVFENVCGTSNDGKPLHQIDYLEGHGAHYLWEQVKHSSQTFALRRDIFLWLLQHLLETGHIKLQRHGTHLNSSVEDQVQMFRSIWPPSEAASGYEDFYWWFFDAAIPASIAWRQPDGSYVAAD
jgi:hypothetical protein